MFVKKERKEGSEKEGGGRKKRAKREITYNYRKEGRSHLVVYSLSGVYTVMRSSEV